MTAPVTKMFSETSGKKPLALVGPDREVAVDRPLESTADSPSVDRPDHRLRAEHDRLCGTLDRLDQIASLGFVVRVHVFAAVVAGTEGPTRSGEDDCPGGSVVVSIVERGGDIVDQSAIHRVQPFRTIEGDDANPAIAEFTQHGLVLKVAVHRPAT